MDSHTDDIQNAIISLTQDRENLMEQIKNTEGTLQQLRDNLNKFKVQEIYLAGKIDGCKDLLNPKEEDK